MHVWSFSVLELVLWCSNHFDATKRIILIGGNTIPLISLSPIIFLENAKVTKSKQGIKAPYEFIQGPTVRGFDPKEIFVAHLIFVGYSNLTKILTPKQGERNQGSLEIVIKNSKKITWFHMKDFHF